MRISLKENFSTQQPIVVGQSIPFRAKSLPREKYSNSKINLAITELFLLELTVKEGCHKISGQKHFSLYDKDRALTHDVTDGPSLFCRRTAPQTNSCSDLQLLRQTIPAEIISRNADSFCMSTERLIAHKN